MGKDNKNLLIIYPHWPPSNLAGVHRPRLIANYINEFGWHPIVLTVKPEYYEEPPDYDIIKTVAPHVEVIYTDARPVPKPRIYGDIGLRSFGYLKRKALEIIHARRIDFIWIPIPSFYTALLGRILHDRTGIPYGIDYIDPWVRNISNRRNWRAVLSNAAAYVLEPIAVKKAALISGVSRAYFEPVLKRNFSAGQEPVTVAMPYGFDPGDHKIKPAKIELPWQGCNCRPVVYAGAFLPMSGYFIQELFRAIRQMHDQGIMPKDIRLYFIGTGNYTHKSISEYAREAGVDQYVTEIRERFPYLHILHFLSQAYGVMVIGSTERHYTASKIFQALLSQRPVFSVFHHQSLTVNILEDARADAYLVRYNPEKEQDFKQQVRRVFEDFIHERKAWQPDFSALEKYSARASARVLAEAMDKVLFRG